MPSERQILIALNGLLCIPRATVCLLGRNLGSWWPPGRTGPRRPEGVALRHLEQARGAARHSSSLCADAEERARHCGATIVTRLDEGYPVRLRQLELPPPVLYCRGSLPAGSAVSIVGSRRATPYGLEAAHFFAHHLAAVGVTVVSGFARGVDAAAHRGAVEAGGKTVAVLGCGLDVVYPRGHRRLAARVCERGAVVSEFPFGAEPLARNFPVRNRIIAALGDATLVVEAAVRSGSLITARLALELGREVFAVPGRIFDDSALGPNALLQSGARPALHPQDLLDALPGRPQLLGADATKERPPPGQLARRVWQALPRGATRTPEEVADTVHQPVAAVLGLLVELEVGGWVTRHPGGQYARRPGPAGATV